MSGSHSAFDHYPDRDDSIEFPVEDLEGDSFSEDDEDEEEVYIPKSNKSRKKSRTVNNFLDVEAEVEDDDAEEDDYVEEEAGFIAEEEEEQDLIDAAEVYRDRDRRAHRNLESRFATQDESQLQNLADSFDARYQTPVRRQQRGFPSTSMAHIPQSALLPSPTADPKMWMLRCREGRERDLVHLLMHKALDAQRRHLANPSEKAWQLHSALFRHDLKGFIYVEAHTTRAVANALEGVTGVYMSKMTLVPIKEMPDVLFIKTVDKSEDLLAKQWVRIKRGKYQGDLARIVDVHEDNVEALVQLIPRLNLDDLDPNKQPLQQNQHEPVLPTKRSRSGKAAAANAKQVLNRPLQRLFNPRDLPDRIQRRLSRANNGQLKLGGETFRDGYLEKWVRITALDVQCAAPMLEEVERFMTTNAGAIDSETMSSLKRAVDTRDREGAVFNLGDRVIVIEGELANVPATIKSLHNKIATIVPMQHGLFNPTMVPTSQLRKHFVPGNAVKVISGRYAGRLGTVVAVDKNAVTFIDVVKHTELQVFARDLADAKDQIIAKTEVSGPLKLESATLPGDRTKMGPPKLPRVPRAGPGGRNSAGRGDPLLNATVRVLTGQYKGFVGKAVVSNRDGSAKVRLEANTRIISVNKADLHMKDASGTFVPATSMYSPSPSVNNSSVAGFGTPQAWQNGSGTPSRYDQPSNNYSSVQVPSRTPNPYASVQTPNPYGSGAMTPYHSSNMVTDFDGERTPAWDAGSKTPFHSSSSDADHQAWGASSTTPGHTNDDAWGSSVGMHGTTPSHATQPPLDSLAWEANEDPWADSEEPVAKSAPIVAPPKTLAANVPSSPWTGQGATPIYKASTSTPMYSGFETPSNALNSSSSKAAVPVSDQNPGLHWARKGVVVQDQGNHAVVLAVDHIASTADLDSGAQRVLLSMLVPVVPVKGDRAILISGPKVGLVGSIIGLHENDAIMCTESNSYESFPLDYLAKLDSV